MTYDELVAHHMRTLGCTKEEAIQLIQDDADIDKGLPKAWDLTEEQLKNSRKLANVTTRRTSGPVKRTKKESPVKQKIIVLLAEALEGADVADEVKISNAERIVDFVGSDGVKYSVTLTAHRK